MQYFSPIKYGECERRVGSTEFLMSLTFKLKIWSIKLWVVQMDLINGKLITLSTMMSTGHVLKTDVENLNVILYAWKSLLTLTVRFKQLNYLTFLHVFGVESNTNFLSQTSQKTTLSVSYTCIYTFKILRWSNWSLFNQCNWCIISLDADDHGSSDPFIVTRMWVIVTAASKAWPMPHILHSWQ